MDIQSSKMELYPKTESYWASRSQTSKCLHIALGALFCLSLSFSILLLVKGNLSKLSPGYTSFIKGLKKIQGALITCSIAIALLGIQRLNTHHKQKIAKPKQAKTDSQKSNTLKNDLTDANAIHSRKEIFNIDEIIKKEVNENIKLAIIFYCKTPNSRKEYSDLCEKIKDLKNNFPEDLAFITQLATLSPLDENSKMLSFREEIENTFGYLTPKLLMSKIQQIDPSDPDSLQAKELFSEQYKYLQEKQSQFEGIKMESPELLSLFLNNEAHKKAFIEGITLLDENIEDTLQSFLLFPQRLRMEIALKHDNLITILKKKDSLTSERNRYYELQCEVIDSLLPLGLPKESIKENLPSFLEKLPNTFYKTLVQSEKEDSTLPSNPINNEKETTKRKLLPFKGNYNNIPASLRENNAEYTKKIMNLLSPTQGYIPLTKLTEKTREIKEMLSNSKLLQEEQDINSFIEVNIKEFQQQLFQDEHLVNLSCIQHLYVLSSLLLEISKKKHIDNAKKVYLSDFLKATKKEDKEVILTHMAMYIALEKENFLPTKDQVETLLTQRTSTTIKKKYRKFFKRDVAIEINEKKLIYMEKKAEKTIEISDVKLPMKKVLLSPSHNHSL